MLKHADGAIVVSDYLADRVRPMLGPNTRLAIAPPVLLGDYATKSDYRQKQDVFSVLTIANMNYTEKADGAIIIAEAMKKASQDRPETRMHLDIVGGGLQLKRLQNVITGLQMPDNITNYRTWAAK
ncbi:hypothetical protein [Thiohalophilus sp.]|uniref:hypothetical protein n=1 Tax=Thiohalophilus sp. TaxID=3028392 RepID=UPI002ACEC88B|nr:hypothetical protein [Thiohalophilus sp.]MDZ7804404.1 hypothetical protein [Thiohalophilus sp.]